MKIIVHKIGNKINGEDCSFSNEELQLDDNMREALESYFLGSFKSEETFQFYSDSYLQHNYVFNSVREIFDHQESFIPQSQNIGRHLYDIAENPRIQGGELFIVFFKAENEKEFDKIGIFKTEKKESFLKIFPHDETFDIEKDQGISLVKIDKAALIFNKDQETGYVLNVVDNNKNGDMYYWFEDFLKVRQRNDEYFQTEETLSIFKDFISKQLPQEYEISKVDQAEFLNKGIEFFKEREAFDFDEFTNEVLQDESVIESFGNFKSDYEQEMQVSVSEEFSINNAAVKKKQRQFKSIIKLDKNFQIHLLGDMKITNGTDENGKYYKLYFEEES